VRLQAADPSRPIILVASHLALIDADDLVEHVERLVARALEGVAADDRAVGATVAQAADLGVFGSARARVKESAQEDLIRSESR
jgi:hypothetical protein